MPLLFSFKVCVKTIDYLDCFDAEGLHKYTPKCTLLAWSRVQSACHSNESVARVTPAL